MITRLAVVPHPPLLVPDLVAGAVAETDGIRSACVAAAKRLTEVTGSWIAVAQGHAAPNRVAGSRGSFRGYGVDVPVMLSKDATGDGTELPLPVLIAGWLRDRAAADEVAVELLADGAGVAECRALGARLAAEAEVLLVLGDGPVAATATGHRQHPDGYRDSLSERVGNALATADATALLELDGERPDGSYPGGLGPWWVLAGAALAARGTNWRGELLYSGAPYGVHYHVAVWDAVVTS